MKDVLEEIIDSAKGSLCWKHRPRIYRPLIRELKNHISKSKKQ